MIFSLFSFKWNIIRFQFVLNASFYIQFQISPYPKPYEFPSWFRLFYRFPLVRIIRVIKSFHIINLIYSLGHQNYSYNPLAQSFLRIMANPFQFVLQNLSCASSGQPFKFGFHSFLRIYGQSFPPIYLQSLSAHPGKSIQFVFHLSCASRLIHSNLFSTSSNDLG